MKCTVRSLKAKRLRTAVDVTLVMRLDREASVHLGGAIHVNPSRETRSDPQLAARELAARAMQVLVQVEGAPEVRSFTKMNEVMKGIAERLAGSDRGRTTKPWVLAAIFLEVEDILSTWRGFEMTLSNARSVKVRVGDIVRAWIARQLVWEANAETLIDEIMGTFRINGRPFRDVLMQLEREANPLMTAVHSPNVPGIHDRF